MPASLIVVNPHASRVRGTARRAAVLERLSSVLAARDGVRPMSVTPDGAGAVADRVREGLAGGARSVVAVGGDGTVREVAAVLAGTGVALGIVPGGTGNIVAGVLGIPRNLEAAVDALRAAWTRPIDLGVATLEPADGGSTRSVPFMVGCGIGFDARVMASTPPDLKRRLGRAAYFATAAWLAARIAAVPYRVTVDGETLETDASLAMAINLGELIPGIIGPRLPVIPDDGLLDVVVVGARGPVQGVRGLLDHLLRTELGHDRDAATLRVRGRTVRLEADPPEPIQVDGDHLGAGALTATLQPGALRVLVPGG